MYGRRRAENGAIRRIYNLSSVPVAQGPYYFCTTLRSQIYGVALHGNLDKGKCRKHIEVGCWLCAKRCNRRRAEDFDNLEKPPHLLPYCA